MQPAGNCVSAKLPDPSDSVCPVHGVLLPLPSRPSIVTVTPASAVFFPSSTTARPRNVVVTACTFSVAPVDSDSAIPSTVAAPPITNCVLLGAWFAGAVMVSVDCPPAATAVGTNAAVSPAGSPVRLSVASPGNPFALVTETVYVVVCPAITFAIDGTAEIVKVLDGVTVNSDGDRVPVVALPLEADTVMIPVAAVDGTINVRLFTVDAVTGAETMPPPCATIRTSAGVPALDTRPEPVKVTEVPIGPLAGENPLMIGSGPPSPPRNPLGIVACSLAPPLSGVMAVSDTGPSFVLAGIVSVTVRCVESIT